MIRLSVLQAAIQGAEHLLGLEGERKQVQVKRARTEIRLDSGWGSEGMITWLLERGYQVTGKWKIVRAGTQARQRDHLLVSHFESGA